jgi:small subunit ribosomal protein S16
MALKIRLSRGGSKKRPFYRIVVAEAAAPRDGRYVERIGHYNPMVAKDNDQRLVVDGERVKHWMGLGAKPTERVQKLLASLSLTVPVEMRDQPKKSAPGKKRAEREAEAAATAEAAAAEAAAAAEEAAAAEAEAPAEEAPAEEAPAEETVAEAPAEEAVAEDAPAEEAPAEEEAAADEEKPAEA